jgi:hypothetical protein
MLCSKLLSSSAPLFCAVVFPLQINMPDDRVIIVSGFLDDPARQTGKPAPSIDVFDYKSKR